MARTEVGKSVKYILAFIFIFAIFLLAVIITPTWHFDYSLLFGFLYGLLLLPPEYFIWKRYYPKSTTKYYFGLLLCGIIWFILWVVIGEYELISLDLSSSSTTPGILLSILGVLNLFVHYKRQSFSMSKKNKVT
ncbi:MAG: hypothetical protein ACOCTN_05580 [Candidatus Natronoplasma sp.]